VKGTLPLFRLAGIQVSLHFTWFIVAALEFTQFSRRYHSPIWGLWEYLALFLIVLLHEFGHAFACRQTGGQADRIVLWPLGGVAFVKPPERPGAYLWSIAAGPLVNVLLFPILTFFLFVVVNAHLRMSNPDLYHFVLALWAINTGILIFNLLPIYPLDGGQILRGLLWLWFGQIRSLQIASVIGLVGSVAFGALAVYQQSIWLGVLAFFIFVQAQAGWRQSQGIALDAETAGRAAMPPAVMPPEDRR
jgi:Zn-dependent protease